MAEYRYHTLTPMVGGMLLTARKRQGWGLKKAAKEIGCDFSYLWYLEQCQRAPSVAMAADIIKGLELDQDEAMTLLAESVEGVGRSKPRRRAGGMTYSPGNDQPSVALATEGIVGGGLAATPSAEADH
jgi:transcriptional regulator with XRE-family HTH domain